MTWEVFIQTPHPGVGSLHYTDEVWRFRTFPNDI
jgi:hypothetical protein